MIGAILESFPSQSFGDVFLMSDRDIINAFFPSQRPKENGKQNEELTYKDTFWQIGRGRGWGETKIRQEYERVTGRKA